MQFIMHNTWDSLAQVQNVTRKSKALRKTTCIGQNTQADKKQSSSKLPETLAQVSISLISNGYEQQITYDTKI